MMFGIVFMAMFIIGFVSGLAMPFILIKLGFYKGNPQYKEEDEPSSSINDILDEYLNGKKVE